MLSALLIHDVIDKFRDTDRPLLDILGDPDSIFIKGLAKFRRRTLYANIVNDRSAVYYTTGITKTDPFTNLEKAKINYVKGYDDVIIDERAPIEPLDPQVCCLRLDSFLSSGEARRLANWKHARSPILVFMPLS